MLDTIVARIVSTQITLPSDTNFTHKIVNIQHMTKDEDRITQRHETVDCERMYLAFQRKNVTVSVHTHDRNTSVNKAIRTKGNVKNRNERWHATKPIINGIKVISSGAKKEHGENLASTASRQGSNVTEPHVLFNRLVQRRRKSTETYD